ncbi:MAG: outer membrane protein transport protein [Desulfobacterales bacterium]|nr:outer membrane protein transport protein [Desulfobacterales bacterium]
MKKISTALIFTFCISFILVNQSFANGVLRDSMGPVSGGRGGTNIAHIDNGILIHDNPSALTELNGKRVEADFDFLALSMNYRDPQNDEDGEDILCFMPSLSYAQELAQGRFGVGFGVYHPAGFSTDYDLVHPIYGEQKYASDACLTKILFGFGWKITDGMSLGIAAGPAYSKVKLEEPYTFQTGPLQGATALIDVEGDAWALAWNIGAQWRISSDTTLGVAYHYQDKFEMRGNCDLDVTGSPLAALVPDPTAHYSKAEFDFTWPQSLGVGMTHRLKDGHRISADVKWIDWSSAFDELTFKLSSGDNAGYDGLAQTSSPKDTVPLDWKDSYSFRLGYEYLLTMADTLHTLRFGYLYNRNPVPDSTLVPVIPGILEHVVSVGYGRNWKNWTFDVAYAYSFGSRQSVGTSKIIGGDYDDSSVDIDGHLLRFGIQYHF